MQIWHVGALSTPTALDGCNNTIWILAKEQAALGHQITLVLDEPADRTTEIFAEHTPKIRLIYLPSRVWRYQSEVLNQLLCLSTPQIVHLHSIFILRQANLAKRLKQAEIPYVITPHSQVVPQRFQPGWLKKQLYNSLIEKKRFRDAAGITIATPREEMEIRSFVPAYEGKLHHLFAPISVDCLSGTTWKLNTKKIQLVYLGRFDVQVKGIDRLIKIARLLPEANFSLYGLEDPKTKQWLERLKQNLPSNVQFYLPVFGAEKLEVLSNATFYIQMSRRDVFGISIAEAMSIGTPCALADSLNIAEIFRFNDLGLVLPINAYKAALALRQALQSEQCLQKWSERGKAFAHKHFSAPKIAINCLQFYEQILS